MEPKSWKRPFQHGNCLVQVEPGMVAAVKITVCPDSKEARINIVDLCVNPWGHVLADNFILTDNKDENLNALSASALLIEDFEKDNYGDWKAVKIEEDAK